MAFTGLVSSSNVSKTILWPESPRAFTQAWTPAFSSVDAEANAPVSDATTPILKSDCAAAGTAARSSAATNAARRAGIDVSSDGWADGSDVVVVGSIGRLSGDHEEVAEGAEGLSPSPCGYGGPTTANRFSRVLIERFGGYRVRHWI